MWIHSSFKNGLISISGTDFLVVDSVLQDQENLEAHHLSYLENKKRWSFVESGEKNAEGVQEDQTQQKKTTPKKRRTRKKG